MSVDKYRELFLSEADDLLESLESALLKLEADPTDAEQVAAAFRALHTLKGSGAMAGLTGLAAFAHEVEAVFDGVRNDRLPVTSNLITLALAAKDHLRDECEDVADPQAREKLLVEFRSFAESSEATSEARPAPPAPASTKETVYRLNLRFAPQVFGDGSSLLLLLDELGDLGVLSLQVVADQLPAFDDFDPERLYLTWAGTLTTTASMDEIREVFLFLDDDTGIEIQPVAEADEAPTSAPAPTSSAKTEAPPPPKREAAARTAVLKIPAPKLDLMVDLVGELVIARSRLSAVAGRFDDPDLQSISEDVERLTSELRDRTMDLRMLPVSSTFRRFERLIRDLSKALNKPLVLSTEGGDTELDKTVLDRLADPLVHLLRNAADHGIESVEERQARGKTEPGTIHLRARQTESKVVIEVEDDGGGLDPARIRKKAIERGLLTPEADVSEQELFALLFEPGFSTTTEVSDVSGRGVGLDVVRRSIVELNGAFSVRSTLGVGTTFTIRLPLSLAIMDGLLVLIGGDPYVFPLALVEECIEPPRSSHGGKETRLLPVRGELVPYLRLRDFFRVSGNDQVDDSQIVITQLNEGRFGFMVDKVVGQHQTVLKDPGPIARNVDGISGATILGDGKVGLIIDAPAIVGIAD